MTGSRAMQSLRVILIVLFTLPAFARADNHRAQDWPEGSAMHTGRLAQNRLAAADKKLNATYQVLLKAMPRDEPDNYPRKALVGAQRAWINYRDTSCALVGEMTGGVRMWKSTHTVSCEAELTEKRTAELSALHMCVTNGEKCQ